MKKRARKRGSTTELVLALALLFGCFVYPLSLALRHVGGRVVDESERSTDANLTQSR